MSLEAPFPVQGGEHPQHSSAIPSAVPQAAAGQGLSVCLRRCIAVSHHTHDELKAVVVCFAPEVIKVSVRGAAG